MRPVTVQFLKNPDMIHWGFEAYHLGEDDWGSWLAVPRGGRSWKGGEMRAPTRTDAVFCAPRDSWWHLHYHGEAGEKYTHFVDIVTPPKWVADDRYEMIDLDLDVAIRIDGSIEVQDEDEFQLHQVELDYTPEMISMAVAATATVLTALEEKREPFFEIAESWLGRV